MEERILVYTDQEYQHLFNRYSYWHRELQQLMSSVKSVGVEPTTAIMRTLLKGESIKDLLAKGNMPGFVSQLPRAMQKAVSKMFADESQEDYDNLVGKKAAVLADQYEKDLNSTLVNFSYFTVEDGEVVLDPAYLKDLDSLHRVYIDTPGKHQVYEKWIQLQKAAEEFKQAVNETPKRKAKNGEKDGLSDPQYIQPFGIPEDFSLVKVSYEGELVLNADRFDCFS